MNFAHGLRAVLIGAAIMIMQPQLAFALTPVEVKAISKEFTVQIRGDGSGTGVIFERKGDTYFVITNHHVVSSDGRYEIQTPDGSRYPVYRSQQLPGLDLAVLQFTSNKNYRTATLGNSDPIKDKITVYVAGWSSDLLPGINERSYGFTVGSILRREPRPNRGYALVYDNEAVPGMSGGPVLDENGRVVGINGLAIREPKTGTVRMGIPINTFLAARNNPRQVATATTATAPRQRTAEDYISLGGAKADREDYKGAIIDYNQAIKINPNNPDAYYKRGSAYFNLNDYKSAQADFNYLISISPKNAAAYAFRGGSRIQQKDYQGGFADGDQAIRLNPDLGMGYFVRAYANYNLKNYQQAIADYDQTAKLLPNLDIYYLRGSARYAQKDYSGAITDFTSSIRRNPKYTAAYMSRAFAYYDRGDKQKALEDLNQVTRFNPKNSQAWYSRGVMLKELGQDKEAIASYDRAIQANSEWDYNSLADAYLNRGNIYNDQRNYRLATEDYNEVIRLKPKNVATAYALRGLNYQRQGNTQAAIADFNSATRIDPNNAVAYFARGLSFHYQQDYQGALAAYEKAIAQDTKYFEALDNIAFVKYELGDLEAAIRHWQAAIAIYSKSADPLLGLATALYTKGEREKGLEMAQSALRLDNRYADIKFLKKNLWGDRILADAQKLLANPKIKITSRPSPSR